MNLTYHNDKYFAMCLFFLAACIYSIEIVNSNK